MLSAFSPGIGWAMVATLPAVGLPPSYRFATIETARSESAWARYCAEGVTASQPSNLAYIGNR